MLLAAGLPVPTDVDAVSRFDRAFGPHPSRPGDLDEGAALYDRLTTSAPRILPMRPSQPAQDEFDVSYALAARNGGEISDEVREAMRRARESDTGTP